MPSTGTILIEQMRVVEVRRLRLRRAAARGCRCSRPRATIGMAVDCLVLDYQMPGMSGLEMASIVRTSQRFADVPIIMLTSVDQTLGSASYRDLLHRRATDQAGALLDAAGDARRDDTARTARGSRGEAADEAPVDAGNATRPSARASRASARRATQPRRPAIGSTSSLPRTTRSTSSSSRRSWPKPT